ncbi:MAG: MATE family efflux transporter [Clostridium sp.]|nr:MATE family efflux transporter [Clostridium sp.]
MKKFKTINFLEGPVSKNLSALYVPLLFAFFFNMAFDINDSLWIGNLLGQKALAAQTISMPLILLYNSICMGITGGIGILLSQTIGAKQKDKYDKIISTSFTSVLIFSLIISLLCEVGINGILSMVNTPGEIYLTSKSFLCIHILSFPFAMIYMYFSAVLRSNGNSIIQLVAVIGCTILNAILDPILIHFFGMNGVAAATVISESIMMIIVFIYCKKNKIIKINLHIFDFEIFHNIISKSIPSAIQQSLPSVSTTFITSLVATFGIMPIASLGTANKIETLLLYPPMAMNIAITSTVGQCFGAKNTKKSKEYLKSGILLGGTILLILTLIVTLFSKNIAVLFGANKAVSQITENYFTIIAFGYICNMITNSILGFVNGAGKPSSAMFLMIFYYIVVRIPLARVLSFTKLGLNGIWYAILISHLAAAAASLIYYSYLNKYTKIKPLHYF